MDQKAEPRARRQTRRRDIDWHQAAELLARGMSTAEVAARLGCSRSALARRRKHDPSFQTWMARCRAVESGPANPPFTDLRPTLHGAIEEEVRNRNVRVILWLADRLKLVTPPSERTPDQELRQILGQLTSEELCEFEALRDAP